MSVTKSVGGGRVMASKRSGRDIIRVDVIVLEYCLLGTVPSSMMVREMGWDLPDSEPVDWDWELSFARLSVCSAFGAGVDSHCFLSPFF